jgi:hypothetical protein
MGSTIMANCPCGYESGELHVGGGMMDFGQKCLAPSRKGRARAVVTRDYWAPASRGVVFYDDPSLREVGDVEGAEPVFKWSGDNDRPDFVLPDVRYLCPACRSMTMRFSEGLLMWD